MNSFEDVKRVQLEIELPSSVVEVAREYEHSSIEDVYAAARAEVEASGIVGRMRPKSRVAVAVGSRGVANIRTVAKAVVDTFLQHGLDPFVMPAMGSHGGGTAEGQIGVLESFGITAESMGVPVLATMEVREIGQAPGGPRFYQDTVSAGADHTFLINRVKPHTDFHGLVESGLSKMAVIGLGKKYGAFEMHERGVAGFKQFLIPAARVYEAHSNVIGGLALVENAYDETALMQVLSVADFGREKEMSLLEIAKQKMGSLAFPNIDVLVVRELGKNISGTGMDTNVIERLMIPREKEEDSPANIAAIAVLDLTPETHGNATGLGLANVTTRRVVEQIDWHVTYTNALTAGIFGMLRASLPMVMPDDRKAIQAAVRGCGRRPEVARIVWIENTLRTDRMWISPSLMKEAEAHGQIRVGEETPLTFSESGAMLSPWRMKES